MRIYSSTTNEEFIAFLRDAAITQGSPSQVIDAIDRLQENEDRESELEKLGDELCDMEKAKDDLYEELEILVRAIDENIDPDANPRVENALKSAHQALERHR